MNGALPDLRVSDESWTAEADTEEEIEFWGSTSGPYSRGPSWMAADLEWLREAGVAYFMASSFRERIEKSAARFTNLSPICEAVFDGVGGSTAGSGFCEWIDEDTGRLLEIEDFEWGDERGEGPAVGLYSETDGERWITEYEGSLCKAFAFDPAFLLEGDLHRRVGIAEETIRKWIQEGDCGEVGGSSGGSQAPLQ